MMRDSLHLLRKYPDRVPVILQKKHGDPLGGLDTEYFLISKDKTCGEIMINLRRRLKLPAYKALFILSSSGKVITNSSPLSIVYEAEKEPDGYLRLVYESENVFG